MGYRLSPDLQSDLIWYWCESETELGVCSNAGSQIATIERRAYPKETNPKAGREALERWRKADAAEREKMRAERYARLDAEIEAMWRTMAVHDNSSTVSCEDPYNVMLRKEGLGELAMFERAPTPAWARPRGDRTLRVRSTLARLVRGESGPRHQRVLFRVYGDIARGRRADELDALTAFAKDWKVRDELLTLASKAYIECHWEEMGERRRSNEAKLRQRRRDFRTRLGIGSEPPPAP